MKRFSVLLLYLVAFVCLLNAKVIKGECGARMTWSFDPDKGILAFSGSGPMYDYPNVTPWNLYKNDVKTVVLAKNVTDMPYYALKGCLSIETIKTEDGGNFFVEGNCLLTKSDSTLIFAAKNFSIPSSTRIIGTKSFYENPSLQTLAIPEGVVTIAEQAFAKCIALKTVSIPSTVEKISTGAFYGCSSLTSVDIPKEGLVNIGKQTFAKCVSLKEINIPSTVKSIGLGAFAKCSSIESVTIPSSTELINMGAFQDCTGLKSLVIEEGVKVIGEYAFQECSSLVSVNIPSTVININNNVFDRCINLRDLLISESNEKFYSKNNKIYAKAVKRESESNTKNQDKIKLSDADLKLIAKIENSKRKFLYEKLEKNVILAKPGTLESQFTKEEKEHVTDLIVTGPLNTTDIIFLRKMAGAIGDSVYSGWAGGSLRMLDLKNATIVNDKLPYLTTKPREMWSRTSWTEINGKRFGFKNVDFNFNSMSESEWKDFKRRFSAKQNGVNYTRIGDNNYLAHYFCQKNKIGLYMFEGCTSLKSIILPLKTKYIGDGAFYDCVNLSRIEFPISMNKNFYDGKRIERDYLKRGQVNDFVNVFKYALANTKVIPYYPEKKNVNATNNKNVTSRNLKSVDEMESHEWVDLGLPSGTLWAKYNVGASSEAEIGSYFAWGETEPKKKYTAETYFDATGRIFEVPNTASLIDTEYDTAKRLWGDEWVMPTREQAVELYLECKWQWIDNYNSSGVSGCICEGPNGNKIFFPAGGLIMGNKHSYKDDGNIWIGTLNYYNHLDWACFISFNEKGPIIQKVKVDGSYLYVSQDYRWWGRNVRAVRRETKSK